MQEAISPDSFQILAEISVGLIGFSGVVVALGYSKLSGQEQSLRLNLLFLSGATALWGGLTPTLAGFMSHGGGWVLSGVLFIPVLLGVNIYAWRNLYRLTRAGGLSTLPAIFYVVTPLTVFAPLWVLYSLFLEHKQIAAAQFFATTVILFLGVYHFYVLTVRGNGVDFKPDPEIRD